MGIRAGENHPRWNGGRGKHSLGYVRVYAGRNERELEHRAKIEAALGKPIPPNAVSHHFDEDKADNENCNLVLCNDRAYHNLLHRRQRAYRACGHAGWLKCGYCGKYDDPENLHVQTKRGNRVDGRHVKCHKEYMEKYHARTR